MKCTILGTGNAAVTECYNTCFVLSEENQYFLVDAGGGNTIFKQLKNAGINWKDIRHIFITHKHVDHVMGIVWLVRMICQHMSRKTYEGEAYMYGHAEVIALIRTMAEMLFSSKETKFIGDRLHLVTVEDGETKNIIGHDVTFFDIQSTKAKQFGFSMDLGNGEKLTCCGDEPYNEYEKQYVANSKWLLHEAFCLYGQADIFKPYEKHHSTVREACQLAEELQIPNLILYHTEDKNILKRKELYTGEGAEFYHGNLFVPDDLDVIELI